MFNFLRNMKLPAQMAIAMVAGSIFGLIAGPAAQEIKFIGDIWLNSIKMVIVPMIIFVVVKGVSAMDSPKTLGRIGLRTLLFYAFSVVFASVVAIVVTLALEPGIGFHFEKATKSFDVVKVLTIKEYFIALFPSNMFAAFSSGNMMQVLIIAIFLGISVVFMPEQYRIPVKAWFVNMSELFMSVINLIMAFSPIGVFAIMAAAIGENGLATFTAMGKMLGTFYLACLIQIIIVNLILLWITTEVTPFDFIRKSAKTWLAAMSTCSSAAVIPVNLDVADKEFRVSDKVSSFTIPFGVPFNQDGGAILSAVVILFSAQAIGIQFGFVELIRMVLICTIVSAGSAAVPGGGIVRLMITSAAFGMPLEIVMLVAAFYRLFDMGTTTMCCIGDLSATIIIDRFERRREMKTAGNS